MSRAFGRNSSSSKKSLILVLAAMTVVVLLFVASLILFAGGGVVPEKKPALIVQTETPEPSVKMVDVLIPVQTIEAGTQLDAAMFRKEVRPQVGVSQRVVKDLEEIQNQFAKSLIIAGQPLHRDFLTPIKPVSNVSYKIPDGFRAVAISVNSTSAVEGWAQPGSKVDVSWGASLNGKPSISVIVQNAKILSAQRNTNPNSDPAAPVPTTVTLLVSAADAQKIQLAQTTGVLGLQLRGDPDTGKINIGDTTITTDALIRSGEPDSRDCQGEVVMGGKEFCLTSAGALKPKVP